MKTGTAGLMRYTERMNTAFMQQKIHFWQTGLFFIRMSWI
jgi:hypothetical protein